MTPLAQKLVDTGEADHLNDRELHEAITWFAVRGIGFTVRTLYDSDRSDREITGYSIQRDY